MSTTTRTTLEALTFCISIERDPKEVYRFASDPQNLPIWASAFCRSILRDGVEWVMEARKGPMTVLFHPENKSGNRDRQVHVSSGIEHYVPMSVFPSEAGSEVILALFHRPSITGKASEDEISSVTDALITLKRALEW